ncbi:ABC transporter permease subunit [Streptomyces stelliscabiei]|uniref:ABC transporter permease subunit n=1 Tax=Streptomyces stelliscabiei TaxID=146820 RepID=UPI0029B516E7|nr:ABC transporter permease subunit [Streptomyces stelliscabiei]MDX2552001.1 ABC transporter permease subunit [Streptomyces stelliscabiei]MDX2609631.1 ABC transporter permease subunit [Streptomyces stelliscabiei]MDX2636849.1 ABC transporter permease subunit [Streptomyces stelliscabiei]MDX2660266.1 ABC transporter permease subunit [Streptomyces stelliscabiei]MDX2710701.1 ABC transporter permease subunit [Streptomyces stelliscabiei]
MSTMTSSDNTSYDSATAEVGRGRGLRLSGMNWLVWRQHRAAYWTLLAATAVTVAVLVYQRQQLITYLEGYGYPDLKSGWEDKYDQDPLNVAAMMLGFLPVLIGVFVGAPLLAGDLETGTAKLVTAQSVSRVRWIATKLGVTALVVVVCTTALSAAFTWWWSPIKSSSYVMSWTEGTAFDNTGPVPVALTLLTVVGGVAIGMLLRRTLLSMVVTLGFAVALQVVWSYFRLSLGNVITVTTHNGVGDNSTPNVPDGAYQVDESYLTASGDLIGWGSCNEQTEKAANACLDKAQVVGWSVDYIPISQMSSMQWLGASILLALTAGIAVFVILWGRKRLV